MIREVVVEKWPNGLDNDSKKGEEQQPYLILELYLADFTTV